MRFAMRKVVVHLLATKAVAAAAADDASDSGMTTSCFHDAWMAAQCCDSTDVFGPKGLFLCFQGGPRPDGSTARLDYERCCAGGDARPREQTRQLPGSTKATSFPDGCASDMDWIGMGYAFLTLSSTTYNTTTGDVVPDGDRDEMVRIGAGAGQDPEEERGRVVALQSRNLHSGAAVQRLAAERLGFSLPHLYRALFDFFFRGEKIGGPAVFSMVNDVIRLFPDAFVACPIVTALAVLFKSHMLASQDLDSSVGMFSAISTLVERGMEEGVVPGAESWHWGLLRQRFHPFNTRVFLNRTTGGRGSADGVGSSTNAITVYSGYRDLEERGSSLVTLPDGRFAKLAHAPTVDVVMVICCEGGISLLPFAVARYFLYDVCGCIRYEDAGNITSSETAKKTPRAAEWQRLFAAVPDPEELFAQNRLFFRDVAEEVPTGEIVAYFLHLSENYEELADVTLFLHPDYREHVRENLLEKLGNAVSSAHTWPFHATHFMYLGWRHEQSPQHGPANKPEHQEMKMKNLVGPHFSRHCPIYDRITGRPLPPCRFDAFAFRNVVRRQQKDIVGDYNPFLLERIWRILFAEEFDARVDDFGGYDFNQFLVSRARVREARPRGFYKHVAEKLQSADTWKGLLGSSGGSSPPLWDAGLDIGGRATRGRRAAAARRPRSRSRRTFGTAATPKPGAAATLRPPRHPSVFHFISERVDLTPSTGWNKGVCIWFEHMWHLLFGPAEVRWGPKSQRKDVALEKALEGDPSGVLEQKLGAPGEAFRGRRTGRGKGEVVGAREIEAVWPDRAVASGSFGSQEEHHSASMPASRMGRARYLSPTRVADPTLPLSLRGAVDQIQLHKYFLTPDESCALLNRCAPGIVVRLP
eukprot:g8255.t1